MVDISVLIHQDPGHERRLVTEPSGPAQTTEAIFSYGVRWSARYFRGCQTVSCIAPVASWHSTCTTCESLEYSYKCWETSYAMGFSRNIWMQHPQPWEQRSRLRSLFVNYLYESGLSSKWYMRWHLASYFLLQVLKNKKWGDQKAPNNVSFLYNLKFVYSIERLEADFPGVLATLELSLSDWILEKTWEDFE